MADPELHRRAHPRPGRGCAGETRVHMRNLIRNRHGAIPAARLAGGQELGRTVVIRLDATIFIAHSDKEQAAGTFKGTFGHHALTAWCDNTDDCLAVKFCPGNAGSNTTADHLEASIGKAN